MEPVEDTIHRTPEFEPEAVNKDAQGLSMAPRMGEPMDELANSPILEVAKQETGIKEEVHDVIKTEKGINEGDIYDVNMTEPIDLKPKTEEIDQSRNSPCAETLKEKLSLKEDEISKSETSSKEENKKREGRRLFINLL